MEHTLADLVAQARETTDGETGQALVLVLHRMRQRRVEDDLARAELHRIFESMRPSVAVGSPTAA